MRRERQREADESSFGFLPVVHQHAMAVHSRAVVFLLRSDCGALLSHDPVSERIPILAYVWDCPLSKGCQTCRPARSGGARIETMKRIISLLLVVSLLFSTAPVKVHAQMGPAVLELVCASAVGTIIFWVFKTNTQPTMRWLVLQKRALGKGGEWQNYITHRVLVGPVMYRAFPAFGDDITNAAFEYRVAEIIPYINFRVVTNYGSARAFIY